jgi:hypothetical protein
MHQAKVRYNDGAKGSFFSTDGRWFYEGGLPDPNARTRPMKYEREWLKQAAGSSVIDSIEFTETRASA